jgi:hypothetical protein
MAVPLAGPILGIAAHELSDRISNDIGLTQALLDDIHAPEAGRGVAVGLGAHGPAARADTDADFRNLRQMLTEVDPASGWGGLSYYITPGRRRPVPVQ